VRSTPCTWRREARVSWLSLKTMVNGLSVVWPQNHWEGFFRFSLKTGGDCFLVEPQNQGGGWFSGLGLKTGSYSLVICFSKSPRRFPSLGLKTNQATACRLHHKTDERAMAWDTRRDLAACFVWKQVRLGFPSLASRLAEAR
jgi:hypothetical protein